MKFKMNKKTMSLFLGALMLFSTIAFGFFSDKSDEPAQTDNLPVFLQAWNGMEIFVNPDGIVYWLNFGQFSLPFRSNPAQAALVDSEPDNDDIFLKFINASKIYLVFDPDERITIAVPYAETARLLSGRSLEIIPAISQEYPAENESFVIRDPWEQKPGELVIYFDIANTTRLSMIDNTLVVQGPNQQDITLASVKFALIMWRLI
ncbi:MAG: hypothetical protein GOU99_01540 [Candidatus Altiarchaeota archaeon]|nr:hypothetical protein [Candidatus Altiarchaeota archaeon]